MCPGVGNPKKPPGHNAARPQSALGVHHGPDRRRAPLAISPRQVSVITLRPLAEPRALLRYFWCWGAPMVSERRRHIPQSKNLLAPKPPWGPAARWWHTGWLLESDQAPRVRGALLRTICLRGPGKRP